MISLVLLEFLIKIKHLKKNKYINLRFENLLDNDVRNNGFKINKLDTVNILYYHYNIKQSVYQIVILILIWIILMRILEYAACMQLYKNIKLICIFIQI